MTENPYGDRALDVQVAEALGWGWLGATVQAIFPPEAIGLNVPVFRDAEIPLSPAWACLLSHFTSDANEWMKLLLDLHAKGGQWELKTIGRVGIHEELFYCAIWLSVGKRFSSGAGSPGEAVCRAVLAALKGGAE